MDVESTDRKTAGRTVISTFLRNKELTVALTCCGGEGGWPRATRVNRRQGWHGGTGEATGG